MKEGEGEQWGERLRKTETGEREESMKSNGFEEHDSNQFLILAGGKKEEGGGERRKEEVGGEREE